MLLCHDKYLYTVQTLRCSEHSDKYQVSLNDYMRQVTIVKHQKMLLYLFKLCYLTVIVTTSCYDVAEISVPNSTQRGRL